MTQAQSHPLLAKLAETAGWTVRNRADLDALLAQPGDSVLFCGGNPVQYPECLDVAVVLPELLALDRGRMRAAVAAPEMETQLQALYGFTRWPSLVFLRDGGYVGTLSGMLDWSVFVARFKEMRTAGVGRPPTVGIAVTTAASHCH